VKKGADKIAAVLAMPMKGKAEDGGEVPEAEASAEDMDETVAVDAAQSVLDAMAAGDAAALNQALKDHYAVCAK
jgi:hypothetical protein